MAIQNLSQLLDVSGGKGPKTLIVVCANDLNTIVAVSEATALGLIRAVLIGDKEIITSCCDESGVDINRFTIIHQTDKELAAQLATEMVNHGEGELLMKGLIGSDNFLRAILHKEKGLLNPGKILSHVTIIENSNYHKLLFVGDAAVIPFPDLNQKIQIIKYLVAVAAMCGITLPKIAVLAPSEKVSPSIPSSADAAILSKMNDRGQIKGCIVDGPLALDVALDSDVAAIKGINSAVAGDADCLLFPNLEAGNIFYKVNTKLAQSGSAAVMMGAKVPVVLASRGDTTRVKLLSIALAVLIANSRRS